MWPLSLSYQWLSKDPQLEPYLASGYKCIGYTHWVASVILCVEELCFFLILLSPTSPFPSYDYQQQFSRCTKVRNEKQSHQVVKRLQPGTFMISASAYHWGVIKQCWHCLWHADSEQYDTFTDIAFNLSTVSQLSIMCSQIINAALCLPSIMAVSCLHHAKIKIFIAKQR